MLSKQVVTGSNPVSRSSRLTCQLASPSLLSITRQLSVYRLDVRSRGYSEATITHVERCVRFFEQFLGGVEDVGAVDGDDLRRFIVSLKDKTSRNCKSPGDRKLSPASINTYARAIRSFWSWLARRRVINNNPLADVPAPRFPKMVARIYTEDQMKCVLNLIVNRPRERAIVELFLDSGIRLSELTGLHIEDLDLNSGTVRVMGKGSKERYSYFSPKTALSLYDYIEKRLLLGVMTTCSLLLMAINLAMRACRAFCNASAKRPLYHSD